jgi:bacteriocin-like protein
MKFIFLNGISEILSEKELKNVMGGSSSWWCPEGEHPDWYYWWGDCVKDHTPSEKEELCEGKSQGAECYYGGKPGHCLSFAGGSLHCSDAFL